MTIKLPKDPKHEDYEDFVAAFLIVLGYFIETNLHLRDNATEVLELDIVATPVSDPLNEKLLLDAKSGQSGFSDIFKMSGWMHYLGISHGCVVCSQPSDATKSEAVSALSKKTSVSVATLSMANKQCKIPFPVSVEIPNSTRAKVLPATWWGRMGQRQCLSAFQSFCKCQLEVEAVKAAKEYRWAIEQSFFAATPIDRARKLYSAYKESPQLTGQVIEHLASGDATKVKAEWAKVRDTSERLAVQHIMVMEHTARLGIMKNALLYVLEQEASPATGEADDGIDWTVFELWGMPSSFITGLEKLKAHPHRLRVPLLFQVFAEVFGGFYTLHDDRDLKALAACTGIPSDQIVGCLELFDEFFPITGGWFFDAKDELRRMKMIPAVFRGAGCFLRNMLFNEKDYSKLYPKMEWLIGKWHNALYNMLESDLSVAE